MVGRGKNVSGWMERGNYYKGICIGEEGTRMECVGRMGRGNMCVCVRGTMWSKVCEGEYQ